MAFNKSSGENTFSRFQPNVPSLADENVQIKFALATLYSGTVSTYEDKSLGP
jgi:hypothetical protein